MSKKLPIGAFEYYVALGEERSFDAVAEQYDVNKRTVTRAAGREKWTERLERIEREAQTRVDEKLTCDLEDMKLRHRKLLRAMASRAAQAIASFPLTDGMQGIKAAELTVKLERILAGEPSDRTETIIADITRQEMQRFLVPEGTEDVYEGEEEDGAAPAPVES